MNELTRILERTISQQDGREREAVNVRIASQASQGESKFPGPLADDSHLQSDVTDSPADKTQCQALTQNTDRRVSGLAVLALPADSSGRRTAIPDKRQVVRGGGVRQAAGAGHHGEALLDGRSSAGVLSSQEAGRGGFQSRVLLLLRHPDVQSDVRAA